MNIDPVTVAKVYTFRFSVLPLSSSPTVVSVAPRAVVHAIFGGHGVNGLDGLDRAFGGGVAFEDRTTGEAFLGVWGRRNASRFRSLIRQSGYSIEAVTGPPPAPLRGSSTTKERPPKPTLDTLRSPGQQKPSGSRIFLSVQ